MPCSFADILQPATKRRLEDEKKLIKALRALAKRALMSPELKPVEKGLWLYDDVDADEGEWYLKGEDTLDDPTGIGEVEDIRCIVWYNPNRVPFSRTIW